MKRIALVLGAVAVLLVGGWFVVMETRAYSVAATRHHSRPVAWLARTTMERSVRAHARTLRVPAGLDLRDPALAARGIGHYHETCQSCHGAPGVSRDPSMVMHPEPPELADPDVVSAWSDAELFWIIKHGLKDTGMVAMGPVHDDAEIWSVAALVRQLPEMTPQAYRALVTRSRASERAGAGPGGDNGRGTAGAFPKPG